MRITVVDLVDQPGATRQLVDEVAVEEFGHDPWGLGADSVDDPVSLRLHLDAVVDGILVRGRIGYTINRSCARCLTPQRTSLDVEVTELFVDPRRVDETDADDDGYVLIDAATAIDLSTMVRDALLSGLPMRVLCQDDCAGLCPSCGADRNVAACGHEATEDVDPRWAALTELRLPRD